MYQHLIQSLLSEVENSPMQHRYVYAYRYQNDTYTAILAQILPDPRFPGPSTITDNTRLSSPIPKPVKFYLKKNNKNHRFCSNSWPDIAGESRSSISRPGRGGRLRLPGRRRGRIRGWGPRSRTWRRRGRRRPRRRGAPQRQQRQVLRLARARRQGRHPPDPLDLHAPDPPEFNSKKRGEGKEERGGGLPVRRRTRRSSPPVRRRALAPCLRPLSPRAPGRRSAGFVHGPLRSGSIPAWNGLE